MKEKIINIDEVLDEFSIYGFIPHNYGSNGKSAAGMWREELAYLAYLALQAPSGDYCETGIFMGSSSCLLGTVSRVQNRQNKLFAVDISFDGYNGAYKYNVYKKAKLDKYIIELQTNSLYLANALADYANGFSGMTNDINISFCLLDSWHSYRAVVTEFEAVKPYLVPGAILALHDLPPRNTWIMEDASYRARCFHNDFMRADMPVFDTNDPSEAVRREAEQDFFILEAVAHILDNNPDFELMPMPPEFECDYRHIAGDYQHGRTSPNNALAAIRKKV